MTGKMLLRCRDAVEMQPKCWRAATTEKWFRKVVPKSGSEKWFRAAGGSEKWGRPLSRDAVEMLLICWRDAGEIQSRRY